MNDGQHVHFVGIGGIGMSGIARVLLQMNWKVSGSDLKATSITRKLESLGATIYVGHAAENVGSAEIVVVSSAIPGTNPELEEAARRGIPICGRSQMLGFLMRERFGIAVAGTHGKTTTTSMIAMVLETAGLEPTVVIGGEVNDIGSNAKLGVGAHLVAEADESDASFLNLDPRIAVITSIDSDVNLSAPAFAGFNFDYDATLEKVVDLFFQFTYRVPEDGRLVLCSDHPRVRDMLRHVNRSYVTYGLEPGAEITVRDIRLEGFRSRSILIVGGRELGVMQLQVPGRHNIQNALAAVAVGLELGIEIHRILEALADFEGVQRRFQILGEVDGVIVVDDYAHNPAKVKAALHSARAAEPRRVIGVFQPHRYTRTKFLAHEFATVFEDADVVLVTDIYSAGEVPIVGVKAEMLVELIRQHGSPRVVVHAPGQKEVIDWLTRECLSGDVVVMLGAGDVGSWGMRFCDYLGNPILRKAAM